jgi:hypothetical protein
MAARTVHDCDRCGAENVPTRRIFFHNDWDYGLPTTEPAGPEYDLCLECLATVLKGILKRGGFDRTNEILTEDIKPARSATLERQARKLGLRP